MALTLELSLLSALVAFTWHVAHSELLKAQPILFGCAIACDLTLTAALCHWLLGVRLGGLGAWTTLPVMLTGVALCQVLLPKELTSGGMLAIAGVALVEASALGLVAVRLRTLVSSYRTAKHEGAETFDALETALHAVIRLPLLAAWARLEIQLWTLCLAGWAFKPQPPDGPNVFTHHKQSHWFTILGVIAFLLLSEGALLHLWLQTSQHTIAKWISLAAHGYCLVWLIGDAQAARIYRSSLQLKHGEPTLHIHVGLRGSAEIPLSDITQITTGSWNKPGPNEALIALQATANIRIELAKPNSIKTVLSPPKTVRTLLLHIDDPEAFQAAITARSAS